MKLLGVPPPRLGPERQLERCCGLPFLDRQPHAFERSVQFLVFRASRYVYTITPIHLYFYTARRPSRCSSSRSAACCV